MKKEDVVSLILYMLILAVSVIYGLGVLQPHFEYSGFTSGILYALYILGSVLASVFVCAVLLEIGHVIGAKIGKYQIIYVCVLHFMFYKKEEKLKFKFSNFDGLTGETKILPKDEKSNPHAYLIMGTLFIALFTGASFALFYLFKDYTGSKGDWGYFFLTMGVVSIICIIYNVLPFKLDSINDGYRMSMVSNPKNTEAFNELLRVEYELSQGNKDVEIKTFTELTNFTASLNMNKLYIALDKGNYDEALELVEIVLKNEATVSRKVYLRAFCMKIFLLYLLKGQETGDKFALENVSLELKKEILADKRSLASIRTYILIEGLSDGSKSECMLAIANVNGAYKATPKIRRGMEASLYNKVIDMVHEVHPKWNLNEYKLLAEMPEENKEEKSSE